MENPNQHRNKNADNKIIQKLNQNAGNSNARLNPANKKSIEQKKMESRIMKMYINLSHQELDSD